MQPRRTHDAFTTCLGYCYYSSSSCEAIYILCQYYSICVRENSFIYTLNFRLYCCIFRDPTDRVANFGTLAGLRLWVWVCARGARAANSFDNPNPNYYYFSLQNSRCLLSINLIHEEKK